jgi:hypothetical protein
VLDFGVSVPLGLGEAGLERGDTPSFGGLFGAGVPTSAVDIPI